MVAPRAGLLASPQIGTGFVPGQPIPGRGLQYQPVSPWRSAAAGGLQGLGAMLMALATGNGQQATAAFQAALQGHHDAVARRREQARQDEEYQFRRDEMADRKAEREATKAERAAAQAKFGELTGRLTDADPANDPTGIKDILPYLPYEQQVELAPELFPKPEGPQSGIGKIMADLNAGLIDQKTADDLIRKETYIAPQQPQGPQDNVSLTPFYTTDAQGNVQMWQPSRTGVPVQVQLPEGIRPSKPLSFQDLGTSVVGVQPLGGQSQVVLPKDVAGEAEQKVTGKAQGDAVEAYRSMSSKMPGLETVIAKLDDLSDKATYTVGGQLLDRAMKEAGMEPRDAAIARAEYVSIVDNQVLPLLRDTFGAAFTQKEGESLRATLGDANASPKEKQAILRSFIEQKRRDIEALALRAAGGGGPAPNEAADPLGIR